MSDPAKVRIRCGPCRARRAYRTDAALSRRRTSCAATYSLSTETPLKTEAHHLAVLEAKLFPAELVPITADAIAQYTWITSRLAPIGYGAALADAHGRAVASNLELAALLRSPEALADVGEAATVNASRSERETIANAYDRARAAAVATYKRQIAEQIAATPKHKLAEAASAYLTELAAEAEAERVAAAAVEAERAAAAAVEAERVAAVVAERARLAEVSRAAAAAALEMEAARERDQIAARIALAEAVAARIQAHGITEIRLGDGALYDVTSISGSEGFGIGGGHGVQFLARVNAALDRLDKQAADAH